MGLKGSSTEVGGVDVGDQLGNFLGSCRDHPGFEGALRVPFGPMGSGEVDEPGAFTGAHVANKRSACFHSLEIEGLEETGGNVGDGDEVPHLETVGHFKVGSRKSCSFQRGVETKGGFSFAKDLKNSKELKLDRSLPSETQQGRGSGSFGDGVRRIWTEFCSRMNAGVADGGKAILEARTGHQESLNSGFGRLSKDASGLKHIPVEALREGGIRGIRGVRREVHKTIDTLKVAALQGVEGKREEIKGLRDRDAREAAGPSNSAHGVSGLERLPNEMASDKAGGTGDKKLEAHSEAESEGFGRSGTRGGDGILERRLKLREGGMAAISLGHNGRAVEFPIVTERVPADA